MTKSIPRKQAAYGNASQTKIRLKRFLSLTGFTLIEVMVAIFILGLGIVTSFSLFPLGLQSFSYARKLNEVYFLAEKKLEEIKSQPQIAPGAISGKEKDLDWALSVKPLQFPEGIELAAVQLDIIFIFSGKTQAQKFVTYVATKK